MPGEALAMIRKCGSKWCLYSKKTGKKLGTHDTKEGAKKQEAAIHAHGSVTANLSSKVADFFRKNPSPSDDQFHSFAEELGIEPDKLEEEAYKLLGGLLKERVSATLDAVAEELDRRGDQDLAETTDSLAYEFERQRQEELDEIGFDDIEKRDKDVAEEISEEKIDLFPYELLKH